MSSWHDVRISHAWQTFIFDYTVRNTCELFMIFLFCFFSLCVCQSAEVPNTFLQTRPLSPPVIGSETNCPIGAMHVHLSPSVPQVQHASKRRLWPEASTVNIVMTSKVLSKFIHSLMFTQKFTTVAYRHVHSGTLFFKINVDNIGYAFMSLLHFRFLFYHLSLLGVYLTWYSSWNGNLPLISRSLIASYKYIWLGTVLGMGFYHLFQGLLMASFKCIWLKCSALNEFEKLVWRVLPTSFELIWLDQWLVMRFVWLILRIPDFCKA